MDEKSDDCEDKNELEALVLVMAEELVVRVAEVLEEAWPIDVVDEEDDPVNDGLAEEEVADRLELPTLTDELLDRETVLLLLEGLAGPELLD